MKNLKHILIGLAVLIAVIFIGSFFYLRVYGKNLFLVALNTSFKRPVTVGKITYQFPLGLRAEKLRVEGLGEAASLEAQLCPQSLF